MAYKFIPFKLTHLFNNVVSPQQHDFCSKKLLITKIVFIQRFTLKSISRGERADLVYTDIDKIDRINYYILVEIGFAKPFYFNLNENN